jgi:hypothetical protein
VKTDKKQKNATIRCLLSTSVSTCFGHHYASGIGVLLSFCWVWLIEVAGRCLVGCEQSENFTVLTSCKTAPHNRYQPHPTEPEQYTVCNNIVFVLLKMGKMMPEAC